MTNDDGGLTHVQERTERFWTWYLAEAIVGKVSLLSLVE
jgi:hypothetical protein